jgi:hypothetical protein
MSEDIEMVFSSCAEWFKDWIDIDPPTLVDHWDLSQWMEHEMTQATKSFLTYGFRTARARNDAIMILRGLYYEYYLFQKQLALSKLVPNPAAVERLPKLPQSNQKSAAWHSESRDMLSAHEIGPVCVGAQGEYNIFIAKKCAPITPIAEDANIESRTVFLTPEDGALSAFKWGWRYEPVARDLFEAVVAEGHVFDGLGRIRHPKLPRLGASPDGLIMDGPRAGRLVEIKCPSTRTLDGNIPIRYYCQMQLQAEVCDVDAVEYVEVSFGAIPQEKATYDIVNTSKKPYIGKVCVVAKDIATLPQDYQYSYSPLFPLSRKGFKDCIAWKPEGLILESSVWYVKDWFNQTVIRNRNWWNDVGYPAYVEFWQDVDAARKDGRYKTKPLFVEEEVESDATEEGKKEEEEKEEEVEEEEEEQEEQEIDHISVDSEVASDDHTSAVSETNVATDSENVLREVSNPDSV